MQKKNTKNGAAVALGSAGGKATVRKHGKKFMRKISRLAVEKRKEQGYEKPQAR